MASNSLRGHGGQRHTPYNLRTNELRLHVKFEPPRFTGLALHRSQTEVQTKRALANICLDKEKQSTNMYSDQFIEVHSKKRRNETGRLYHKKWYKPKCFISSHLIRLPQLLLRHQVTNY